MVEGIVYWSLIMIVSGVIGAYMAASKNRDWSAWAAWCFLIPPMLVLLVLMPKRKGPPPRRPTLDEEDLPS